MITHCNIVVALFKIVNFAHLQYYGACTSFHAPREHWSIGALLIFFCSRIVLQKMYEVLLQRSKGAKEQRSKGAIILF